MANDRKDQITFEITRHCGVLSAEKSGWTRELNVVSWNGGEAKYDIREWSPDHNRMTRGITLTANQASKLAELLVAEAL